MKAIMACDANFGIGKDGSLPWPRNTDDLREFRDLTTNHIVIMGSKTWEDPVFPKPLPNRKCYIITRNPEYADSRGFIINKNLEKTIRTLKIEAFQENKDIWVIGGAEILELLYPYIEEFHLTVFHENYDCDKFIKNPLETFKVESSEEREDCVKYILKR